MEIDLQNYEKKVFSQHGEDGIIEKIFEAIGTTNKYYVEFGVENGEECNTRNLREKYNWSGLLMDGVFCSPSINLREEYITAENINRLFRKYKIPIKFDLLNIDIDYNDFYVWMILSRVYKPRVVVIEYNSSCLPYEDKVAKYKPFYSWDFTNYFGASLLALYRLGEKNKYSLVYAEKTGTNAFFISNDCLPNNCCFKDINNVDLLYRPPGYGCGGHPKDVKKRKYFSSEMIINCRYHKIAVIYFFDYILSLAKRLAKKLLKSCLKRSCFKRGRFYFL